MGIHQAPFHPEGLYFGLMVFRLLEAWKKDRAMKNETTSEMVLQTTVALLALGLAVMSFLLMGRWV
jgi:hypothetical protein